MKLSELKQQILNNNVSEDFKIFLYEDNRFLVNQYLEQICFHGAMKQNRISSLVETKNSALALVFDYDSYINILITDTFEEVAETYSSFTNTIVVCKKVDKKILSAVQDYIINFPKLKDWQLKDYAKLQCKGLDLQEINWLYQVTNEDTYRFINEIDKIKIFSPSEQKMVLAELKYDINSDLYTQTIFNISEAIIKQDKIVLLEYLSHRNSIIFEPLALISLLLGNFKKILFVNFDKSLSPETIGITDKQYNKIRSCYRNITQDRLLRVIELLSSFDQQLKEGKLDISKNQFFDYILCKLLI